MAATARSTSKAAPRWVALFYSIVVGPTRRLTSADLFKIAEVAGLADARTALATGNLIGRSRGNERQLESRLEHATEIVVGRKIPVFCRAEEEWEELVAAQPFRSAAPGDTHEVIVRVLRRTPTSEVLARLAEARGADDRFRALDRSLWVIARRPVSASRLVRAVNAAWVGEGTARSASSLAKITSVLREAP